MPDTSHPPARTPLSALPWRAPGGGWKALLLVMLAAAAVFLPLLGSFGLWDPWETHYGEVGRQITERNDWISPWWGAHWQDAGGSQEGEYFFSKPILLMWVMAIGIKIFGIGDFSIRIGVCLIAILGIGTVYSFGREVWNHRVGLLMSGVLGTAPFYFFLGRQAQTDMPFVGLMTIAMCFFMMGAFGKSREEPADRTSYLLTGGWAAALIVPQISLLMVGLSRWRGGGSALGEWVSGHAVVGIVSVGVGLGVAALLLGVALWKRRGMAPAEVLRGGGFWRKRRLRFYGFLALGVVWVPLLGLLVGVLATGPAGQVGRNLSGWFVWSGVQASIYATCFGWAVYWCMGHPDVRKKRLFFLGFYLFVGLATLAKGLLGFMLPGAIFFIYLLITREWKLLKEVELLRGIPLFIAVTFPWYAAMLIRHTYGFWERFFVHDHFKRLSGGVHQVDEGSFEHFARWLGYGFFPWSGFVPAALARFFVRPGLTDMRGDREKATVMVLLWLVVAFTLFTLSSTKFHHYIFPALPPLAMLTTLALDDLLEAKERPGLWPLYLLGLGIIAALAWDIIEDPQVLKNLFTYKYDRTWENPAWDRTFRWTLGGVSALALVGGGMTLWARRRVRQWGIGVIFGAGVILAYFSLDYYMPIISQTWSQSELWKAYYAQCDRVEGPPGAGPKRFCAQPVIAYMLNWRGETYYTQNEVIPIRDEDDFTHFLSQSGQEPFFAIMEMARYQGDFGRKLPPQLRDKVCITYSENPAFLLAKVPCAPDDPLRKKGR